MEEMKLTKEMTDEIGQLLRRRFDERGDECVWVHMQPFDMHTDKMERLIRHELDEIADVLAKWGYTPGSFVAACRRAAANGWSIFAFSDALNDVAVHAHFVEHTCQPYVRPHEN